MNDELQMPNEHGVFEAWRIRQPTWARAVHGVPALAGRVLLSEADSVHCDIHGETASDRLKPGLHALWASEAYEICALGPLGTMLLSELDKNSSPHHDHQ